LRKERLPLEKNGRVFIIWQLTKWDWAKGKPTGPGMRKKKEERGDHCSGGGKRHASLNLTVGIPFRRKR